MRPTTEAVPAGALTPVLRDLDTTSPWELVMPYPQSIHRYPEPTTDLRPRGVADPKPDGCPNCLIRGNQPRHVRWTPDGSGYYATYRCANCAHSWWTGWGCEPAGEVVTYG